MFVRQPLKLFGTRRRTQVLLLLSLLDESHASEIARLLGTPAKTIQRVLGALEDENVVVGRQVGRERRVLLNPRYAAVAELKALLRALTSLDAETEAAAESLRRRPRKQGKEL